MVLFIMDVNKLGTLEDFSPILYAENAMVMVIVKNNVLCKWADRNIKKTMLKVIIIILDKIWEEKTFIIGIQEMIHDSTEGIPDSLITEIIQSLK